MASVEKVAAIRGGEAEPSRGYGRGGNVEFEALESFVRENLDVLRERSRALFRVLERIG